MEKQVQGLLRAHQQVMADLSSAGPGIADAAGRIITALGAGRKLIVFGNGGSAADSQHFVAELVGRFKKNRRALAAIALTTNSSTITALANDFSYDLVFDRQIEALAQAGDVAVGISTSGTSPNVLRALERCRTMNVATIGLCGAHGKDMQAVCDAVIAVPSKETPRVQEAHAFIIHAICELVEDHCS